ncbi:hypothetical protein Avbf_06790, partial [Armadillidium vulgare]
MLFILLNYFEMKIRLPMATIFNLVGMFILFGLPASISCSSEIVYAPALSSPSTGTVEEETPLSCWACNTTDENDGCFNLTEEYLSEERMQKCMPHQKYCKVERVWYIISVNKPAHNFSIYRNCTEKCEPYCLIMGDRTKDQNNTASYNSNMLSPAF